MTKPLSLFILSSAVLLCCAAPVEAQTLQTKRFGLSSFERVEVQGDMIVEISASPSISAVAEGPSTALDTLSLEVRERTLVIRHAFEGSYGQRQAHGQGSGPVRVRLTAQNLSSVSLAGSGTVRVEGLRGSSIQLVVDGAGSIAGSIPDGAVVSSRAVGSGSITLSGRARSLTAITNGAASINAAGLPVRDLTVQAVGSGASSFAASATANIFAMGSANVAVSGRPRCTVRNAGAGTIACGDDARSRLPQSADNR
ncbi:hypothetical protein GV829_06870 [Sphingomonas lacunae]|uniref:Putative auto-transporter adhesin head GIN domain-containing protein n=1 Tax=Sphingomonas lacunae TaxID=2698828 RepID=A0A6M4AW09_9SPHN|nr:DUF2807 domain-containing protein [Sphingomonas lacunae]QJQ32209.1 hypothetical protein GV829_06870 [Sphingomonas lacunae]